jgi:translocation and assembly module TamA
MPGACQGLRRERAGAAKDLKKAGIFLATAACSALVLASVAEAQTASPAAPAQPDEPIVPDSQFEKELPPVDPDLTKPLEPIDTFNVEGQPPATTPEGTLAPPANPPPDDPALAEPLPPLSSFDVETPPAGTATEDEEPAARIRYSLTVEGLDSVGLEGRFRSLSALGDADGEATNGAMISARAKEDELLAVRILRSEGYYDGTAISSIEQLPDEPGRLRVTLTAVPGQRYNLGAIAIAGPETVPAGLPRQALPLESGAPIVAANVEAAEANVRLRLPQQGYPFAEVGLRDILLDPATHAGDYTLPVEPGPRARFGGFTTEGSLAFDAKHVGTLSRFRRGELYDNRKVDDLREAMIATSLFRTVSAEPVRTGEIAEDGSEYVNILVRQEKGPSHSISGNAGYSTGQGLRAEATWEGRNMFPPEGGLRLSAVGGTQEQSVSIAFRRMNAGKRDRTVYLVAEAGRRDLPAFKGYTARIQGTISRESTPIWQKRWTWAYGGELIATNESETRFPALSIKDAFFLAGVTAQLGYDRSNSLLDPTKGFRILGRTNPEVSLREPTQPYIRNIVEGSVYYPATDQLVVAARTRVGSIYGADLAELAPSRRLYGGGGGSVRGFGYQELGPKDAAGRPTGGRSLIEFALEARYRFGNYGIVPFIDAGQVYESRFPSVSDMRFGVGIGGRLYTNFGPLRADVAMPIGRRKGESKFAIYISIGQAF